MEWLQVIVTILVPSVVTILGLIISFKLNQKNSLFSLTREKALEEQTKLSTDIAEAILSLEKAIGKKILEQNYEGRDFSDKIVSIANKLECYGSTEAVKLMSYYKLQSKIHCKDPDIARKSIAVLVLLLMQTKYDCFGYKTSPKFWYIGKYSEYKDFFEGSCEDINKIVEELKLEKFLYIKSKSKNFSD